NTNSFFDGTDTLICDDAHAAEDYVAKYWSVLIAKRDHRTVFDALVGSVKALISPGDYNRLRSESSSPWDRDWVEKIPTPIITPAWPGLLALLDEHLRDSKLSFPWSVIRDYLHAC